MGNPEYLTQQLVQRGVKEVPQRFIKAIHQRPYPQTQTQAEAEAEAEAEYEAPLSSLSSPQSIPLIDLAALEGGIDSSSRAQTLQQIHDACQNWGFFQVVNHGIPSSLLQLVRDVSRHFFQLPLEEKQKLAMKPGELLGYGRHYEHLEDAVLDWVDCVLHYVCPDSLRDEENTWPSKPADYKDVMDAYGKEIRKLNSLLLPIFTENLGLPPTYLETVFGEFNLLVRLNWYSACPQPNLVMGNTPHSDINCVTFVLQDEVEGLQVKHHGKWVTVQPIADGLVVNLGDMLQVASNGRYVSVEHRVIANNVKERMSIAAFYTPSEDALISPITALTDTAHPPLYQEINYRDYTSSFVSTPLEGKARVDSLLLAS